MRSHARWLGLVVALIVAAADLQAQSSFMLSGGGAIPVGSTSDDYNTGYNVSVGIGIQPPLAPIGLRIEGLINELEGKQGATGKLRTMAGVVSLTLSGTGMALPMGYLVAGVGFYNVSHPDRTVLGGNTSNSEVGFNVGGGINFPLTGFSTFLEARLHYLNDSKAKIIPLTFGLRF